MVACVYSATIGLLFGFFFFFSSRRRHTRCGRDWSSDVCSSDLERLHRTLAPRRTGDIAGAAWGEGAMQAFVAVAVPMAGRSGERRVGEEGRSRGVPDH